MSAFITSVLLTVLLLSFDLTSSASDRGVKFASKKSQYGQLVTSSTLRWEHPRMSSSSEPPRNAVRSGTGNPKNVVCRADHHGAKLVGHTVARGQCAVAFFKNVYKKSRFEILINIDQSSKLEWRTYAKFLPVPVGAISGGDDSSSFVGRYLSRETGRYLPGAIAAVSAYSSDLQCGAMTAFDDERDGLVFDEITSGGDILVEVEPEKYEIHLEPEDRRSSGSKPRITSQDTVLAKASIFRFDEGKDSEARLQKVLSYDYEKSDYYGQIPGMLRALPSTIRTPEGQIHSLLWGLHDTARQKETLMVGYPLRHHSAVDVSIVGVRVTEEKPYRASVTAVFPDGSKRTRRVEGTMQRRYLNNIRPEYSRVYAIKDANNGIISSPIEPKVPEIDKKKIGNSREDTRRSVEVIGKNNEDEISSSSSFVASAPLEDELTSKANKQSKCETFLLISLVWLIRRIFGI